MLKRIVVSFALVASITFTGCESPLGSEEENEVPRDSVDIHITRSGSSPLMLFLSPSGEELAALDKFWSYDIYRTIRVPHYNTIQAVNVGRYDTVYSTIHVVPNGVYTCREPSGTSDANDRIDDIYASDTLDFEALGWN